MTSENSTAASAVVQLLVRLGRALRDAGRAHEELWARLERIDPNPWEELHWEPTAGGWRLYGSHLPGERSPST
jgi:hypothetical protein